MFALPLLLTLAFQSTGPLRDPTNPQVPCGTRRTWDLRLKQIGQFQSTGPLRDPTGAVHLDDVVLLISIHRSLAGPDEAARAGKLASFDFNPQVPCGTRREYGKYPDHGLPISIHRSFAGPDIPGIVVGRRNRISIHRSLAGPDGSIQAIWRVQLDFNPQVPCGTRRSRDLEGAGHDQISIHRSLAGPDKVRIQLFVIGEISIHRSLAGPD